MIAAALALSAALLPSGSHAQSPPPEIVSQIAKQADAFFENAPKALTRETLEQRATLPASRFRPQIGKSAGDAPNPPLQERRIVSEYTIGPIAQSGPGMFGAKTQIQFNQLPAQAPGDRK